MNKISIEEGLQNKGYVVYGIKGVSMNPLLVSGRDKVLIKKVNKPLKKGDIALYKRNNGKYILHRIIKAKNGDLVLCGDNQFILEKGIKESQILGVCSGYFKKDKYIDFDKSFKYKLYKTFYGNNLFIRKIFKFFIRVKNLFIKKAEKV